MSERYLPTMLDELKRLLRLDGWMAAVTDAAGLLGEQSEATLLDFLLQEERLWMISPAQWQEKLLSMNRLSATLELELPGIYVSAAPLRLGKKPIYLWAIEGVDGKAKERLLDYAASHYGENHPWYRVIRSVSETDSVHKYAAQQKLEQLVRLISCLLKDAADGSHYPRQLETIYKAAKSMKEGSLDIGEFLSGIDALSSDECFCGYAAAVDEDKFCIAYMPNLRHKRFIGVTFPLGEGFLGQAAMIGEFVSWQDIGKDPRSRFFTRHDLVPSNIYCVPVRNAAHQVDGLIFFGSCRPDEEPAQLAVTVRVFAELVETKRCLDSMEQAYRKQNVYLASLIEITRLVNRVQDLKSLLAILVDISLNLVEGARSSLFLFRIPGQTKANIVSRGISQEEAQSYCKDLVRRYFETAVPSDQPVTADTPWGERALECPIILENGLAGLISVFLPKKLAAHEYLSLLQAFTTLSNLVLEKAVLKQAENEKKKEIHLLYEVMGIWNEEKRENAARAKALAEEFGAALSMPEEDISLLASACLLAAYPAGFLKEQLPQYGELTQLMAEYEAFASGAGSGQGSPPISATCHAMILVMAYVSETGRLAPEDPRLQGLPAFVKAAFFQWIKNKQAVEFEATIDTDRKGEDPAVRFDELVHKYKLSSREQEVYEHVVKGLNNREIAEALFISDHTVKNHITNLFQKLNVSDRAQAIALAYRSVL